MRVATGGGEASWRIASSATVFHASTAILARRVGDPGDRATERRGIAREIDGADVEASDAQGQGDA